MEKMTPREALKALYEDATMLFHNNVKVKYPVLKNVIDALESFILATEQAPTLEKLGYVRDKAKEEVIKEAVRIYKGNGYTIEFIEDGEISIGKWDCDYDCSPMTVPELIACAEVIKEMEKEEKMKRKEETK